MHNETALVDLIAREVRPMTAEAFDTGRRRLMGSLRSERRRRIALRVAIGVWAIALVWLPVDLIWLRGATMLDLEVYRNGGLAWLRGIPLYVGFPGPLLSGPNLPFTYPPLAAVLFSVFAAIPLWLSRTLVTVVSFLALSTVTVVVAGRLDKRLKWTLGPAAAVAALYFEPVGSTFGYGQVNLVLMALVVADCLAVRRFRGVLVGLAAAIKLTPLVFIVYFLVTRDRRSAATAVASFVGFAVIGLLLAPRDTVEFWFHAMVNPERITTLSIMTNESLRAELYRLPALASVQTLLWVVLAVLVLALAWRSAHRARNDVVALVAIAAAGLLVSPISWSHHWVWVVPALMAFGWTIWRDRAWRGLPLLLVACAVFCIGPPYGWLPSSADQELKWTVWQHIPGAAYVWLGLGLLAALAFGRDRIGNARPGRGQ
ncbi:glycosyltransferase 87 family protein [Kutzneria sp. 744]|uniref:glycosyltransferase 87 family protein n=1 Tax=Kutzneria sp. (strain 744) TaxID=345341 RepID=UPI0003EED968|nr:glycosyltransferase 87 family protein [Kutzneria sp. 744]EWM11041.1 membrane protein [Kutzneria sp. 744]